ncbi:MAG: DUF6531 domain-containing protein [Lachnospiraceae bacterium]
MSNSGSKTGSSIMINKDYTWDQADIAGSFEEFRKINEEFLSLSDGYNTIFRNYVNDESHTGNEADSTKKYITGKEIQSNNDYSYLLQLFDSNQRDLLDSFKNELNEDDSAHYKLSCLDKMIEDFKSYNKKFRAISEDIERLYKNVCARAAVTGVDFTEPHAFNVVKNIDAITDESGKSGMIPKVRENYEAFISDHTGELSGSQTEALQIELDSRLKKMCEQMSVKIGTAKLDTTKIELESKGFERYGNGRSSGAGVGKNMMFSMVRPNIANPVLAGMTGKSRESYLSRLSTSARFAAGAKPGFIAYASDPVNMSTGNYVSEETDIKIGGTYPLVFRRFYNSIFEQNDGGILGAGWSTDFGERMLRDGDDITISYSDGSKGTYKQITIRGKKAWEEIHGEPGVLSEEDDGFIVRMDSGSYVRFDKSGLVTERGDHNGKTSEMIYESVDGIKRLAAVKTPGQGAFLLNYGINGRLESLKDHTGRTVSYSYEGECLTGVIYPDGTGKAYKYSDDGRITAVVNRRGITSIQNSYDDAGRITKQVFADGGCNVCEYDDGSQTVTLREANGNVLVYEHDEFLRHTATKYYDGEERFTYNRKNQKISYTDKLGFTTRYSYDNKGHLTSVNDPEGNKTSITYNAKGKVSTVKLPDGNSYKYSYDVFGNLFEVKDPLGNKRRFYYEGRQLIKVKDEEGNITLVDHDEDGNISCLTDPAGVKTFYSYDALGRVKSTRDMTGAETAYEYDNADRLIAVTDPLGNRTAYEYNEAGKVTKLVNSDGGEKSWKYNEIGRPCVFVDEEGRMTEVSYNTMHKKDKIILPNGGVIRYEYDPLMRITGITDPEGVIRSYTYDAKGRRTSESVAGKRKAAYEYDTLGRRTSVTDAVGNTTRFKYDNVGNLIEVIDACGNTTRREYDAVGRLILVVDPIGNKTSIEYNGSGKVKSSTDALGRKREYEYENGKLVAEKYQGKLIKKREYDRTGRLSKVIYANGHTLTYIYDAAGRVTHMETSSGRTIDNEYDSMGRRISQNDCGSVTAYEYTGTGKLKKITDAVGNVTEYSYDALGQLSSVERKDKNGKGHLTVYEHDLAGRLVSVIDPLGNKETYTYDDEGKLKIKKDRDGFDTAYRYDEIGLISGIDYADGKSVKLSYDALGRLKKLNDWLGNTDIVSDALGRVISVTDHNGRSVGYEYDAAGNRSAVIYPDGHEVRYEYDDDGKLVFIRDEDADVEYIYDKSGRLTGKNFANGSGCTYEYYPDGHIKSLINADKDGILDDFSYEYNEKGLRTAVTRRRRGMEEVSGRYEYNYDPLQRIESVLKDGSLLRSYTYDEFGNRVRMEEETGRGLKVTDYVFDAADRLVSDQAVIGDEIGESNSYSYDGRGNLISKIVNGVLKKTYSFDAAGMMTAAEDPETGRADYDYNGLGFRTSMVSDNAGVVAKTEYLIDITRDAFNLLEMTVDGEKESFVYDRNVVSMKQHRGGSRVSSFYLQDELGSMMRMTGTDGYAYDAYAYDEFGRDITSYDRKEAGKDYIKEGNLIQPFAFTGYQTDNISGMYFAQARSYDPITGRFNGKDIKPGSAMLPDSLNRYVYCLSNPIQLVDVNGKCPEGDEGTTDTSPDQGDIPAQFDVDFNTVPDQYKESFAQERRDLSSDWIDKYVDNNRENLFDFSVGSEMDDFLQARSSQNHSFPSSIGAYGSNTVESVWSLSETEKVNMFCDDWKDYNNGTALDIDLFDSRRVSLLNQNYYSPQLSDRVTPNLDYSNFVKDNSELQISSGESNIDVADGDGNDYSLNEDLETTTHPVLVIGVSGSAGAGGNVVGGVQTVIDPTLLLSDFKHSIAIQGVGGFGIEAGASARGSVYVGTMVVDKIKNLEGFGTEEGLSGGEGMEFGVGVWQSGEETDPSNNYYGGYISAGIGVEGTGASGHINMTGTTPSFYPFKLPDYIISAIGWGNCEE